MSEPHAAEPVAVHERLTEKDPGTPVFCGFFTPGYKAHAQALMASLRDHGQPYCIYEYGSFPAWETATRLKPFLLASVLERLPDRPLIYTDADSRLVGTVDRRVFADADLALRFFDVPGGKGQRLLQPASGTLYLGCAPLVRHFVAAWCDATRELNRHRVDQDSLAVAIARTPGLRIVQLPDSLVHIAGRDMGEAVIEHLQESRNQTTWKKKKKQVRRLTLILALAVFGIVGVFGFLWQISR